MTRGGRLGVALAALALAGGACGEEPADRQARPGDRTVVPPPLDENRSGTPPAAGQASPPELTRGGRECGDLIGPGPRTAATSIVASGVGCTVALAVTREAERGRRAYTARGFACSSERIEGIEAVALRYQCVRQRDESQITFNVER